MFYFSHTFPIDGNETLIQIMFAFCDGHSWLWNMFHGWKRVTTSEITFSFTNTQMTKIIDIYRMYEGR